MLVKIHQEKVLSSVPEGMGISLLLGNNMRLPSFPDQDPRGCILAINCKKDRVGRKSSMGEIARNTTRTSQICPTMEENAEMVLSSRETWVGC
jgi:hypothetical protein